MAIAYVVTKGCYSDYHIIGVCSTREKAEKLAHCHSDGWDQADVEEYEMDPLIEKDEEPREYWVVTAERGLPGMRLSELYFSCSRRWYGTAPKDDTPSVGFKEDGRCVVSFYRAHIPVDLHTEPEALKIVQDKIAELEARLNSIA